MRKAASLLKAALGRDEVVRQARAQAALRDWESIVGPLLAQKSTPERYQQGTLWVAVSDSVWAQELRLKKDVILGHLQDICEDKQLFLNIRFGVRPVYFQPPEIVEAPSTDLRAELVGLSIQEIRERRIGRWRDEN